MLAQVRIFESVAIYRGDEVMALAMFGRHGWRRTEMALAIAPDAARHMRRLVRMAQLTLLAMADTRLIVARILPANPAGQRMAMLTGFSPARLKQPGLWILRSERHGEGIRWRRGGRREAGGGTGAQGTGGGE